MTNLPPIKAKDIGLKQLRALANLPPAARWEVIGEGLPILLRSAETLYAAGVAAGKEGRVGQILQGHATEEAAKILILLDYVRCPLGLSKRAQGQFDAFYDHGARLIYSQACSWKPVDVAMLREYVDHTRASHYVEGDCGEYIMPNWELYSREARLYGDLARMDAGALVWNDPDAVADAIDIFGAPPISLRLVRALARAGAFTRPGLQIVHEVWSPHAFEDTETHELATRLVQETLERLIAADLPSAEATEEDARTLYREWQMPMYAIDAKPLPADLADLQAEQRAHLYAQY